MVEKLLSLVLLILPTFRVDGGYGVDGLVSVLGSILTYIFFLTNLTWQSRRKFAQQEVLI